MSDLAAIFGNLVAYVTLRAGEPLPPPRPGITWLWAAGGIYKRGVDAHRDILIRVTPSVPPIPGLASIRPHVRFRGVPGLLPTHLLDQVLLHARLMGRCEQQYFLAARGEHLEVLLPPQEANASRVAYTLPADTALLVDLHSHHTMRAYFSPTDDRDDVGLSISGVLGRLDTERPELVLRANVYGHRQCIPPTAIFAGSGLFAARRAYADARA